MWHTFSKYLCHSKHPHAVPKPGRKTPQTPTVEHNRRAPVVGSHLHRLGHLGTFIARLLHLPEAHKDLAKRRSSRELRGLLEWNWIPEEVLWSMSFMSFMSFMSHLRIPNTTQHPTTRIWKRVFTLQSTALVGGLSFWYLKHTNQRFPTSLLNSDFLTEQQKIQYFQ